MQDNNQLTESDTPLLARIPLIGWIFKKRSKTKLKTNLMIFISPKIIHPRRGGGIDPYTDNKLCLAENNLQESTNFENLRDPITRWFFKPDVNYAYDIIDDYTQEQSEFQPEKKPKNVQKKKIKRLEKLIHNEGNPLEPEVQAEQRKHFLKKIRE